jgi:formylglycine-generating enzyme required for sulfatase activity
LIAALVLGTVAFLTAWRAVPAAPDVGTRARELAAVPAGMIYVPGGEAIIGTDDADADDDARPLRRRFVPSFYIDRLEVTNEQYRRFKPEHQFGPGEERVPVTNVTYDEAAAYAAWVGKRLPTEAEWEKAARGGDDRRYPWGDRWDTALVAPRVRRTASSKGSPPKGAQSGPPHCPPSRLAVVGLRREGASPYGCLDMAGNAWEWVQGFYQGNRHQRILRGGAVGYGERACRTYGRAIEGAAAT